MKGTSQRCRLAAKTQLHLASRNRYETFLFKLAACTFIQTGREKKARPSSVPVAVRALLVLSTSRLVSLSPAALVRYCAKEIYLYCGTKDQKDSDWNEKKRCLFLCLIAEKLILLKKTVSFCLCCFLVWLFRAPPPRCFALKEAGWGPFKKPYIFKRLCYW